LVAIGRMLLILVSSDNLLMQALEDEVKNISVDIGCSAISKNDIKKLIEGSPRCHFISFVLGIVSVSLCGIE
jgi:hypothetical protein